MKIIKLIIAVYLIALSVEHNAQSYSHYYDHTNSPLDEHYLYSLAVDSNQVVWVGSYPSVYRFIDGNWSSYDPNYFTDTLNAHYYLSDIQVANNGSVWISKSRFAPFNNKNKSLFRFIDGECKSYYASTKVLTQEKIFMDEDNIPWFTLKNWWPLQEGYDKIGTLVNDTLKIVDIPWMAIQFQDLVKIKDSIFVAAYTEPAGVLKVYGNVWTIIATIDWRPRHIWKDGSSIIGGGEKLCMFNGVEIKFFNSVNSFLIPHSAIVSSFIRENDSTFWVGTNKGHLLKVINGKVLLAQEYENIEIIDLAIDKRKNKWMILKNKGVCVYNENGVVNVQADNILPPTYKLYQNYPNPFNPITTISYSIPKQSNVRLKIYDLLGNEIAVLVDEEKSAGNYEVKFNGSSLSSGIYFYTLQAGDFCQTRKLVLLK